MNSYGNLTYHTRIVITIQPHDRTVEIPTRLADMLFAVLQEEPIATRYSPHPRKDHGFFYEPSASFPSLYLLFDWTIMRDP